MTSLENISEKAHDSQFAAEALVAVQLGVGLALFPDDHQLRAEAEVSEGALEGGELEGLGEVFAFCGPQGEIERQFNTCPFLTPFWKLV